MSSAITRTQEGGGPWGTATIGLQLVAQAGEIVLGIDIEPGRKDV